MFTPMKFAAAVITGFSLLMMSCTPGKNQLRQNSYDSERMNYGSGEDSMNNDQMRQGSNPVVRSGMKRDDGQGYANKNRVSSGSEYDQKDGAGDRSGGDGRNDRYSPDEKTQSSDSGENRSQDGMDRGSGDTGSRDGYFQTGNASWYGREFHGKVTASGERFNMNRFTGAHKTLPFGTVVEVKNLDNGKTTTVEINDRGPYRGNRIIDLSYSAAKNLGMLSTGLATVGLRIVKKGDTYADDENYPRKKQVSSGKRDVEPVVGNDSDDEKVTRSFGDYSIQAGAFYSRKKAENLKRKIEGLTRNPVTVINDGDLYKVRVDGIESRKEAKRFKGILRDEKIEGYIINKE